ncbi:phytoene desaturase family protein [Streptomyces sp. NPDC127098]|uniref:phytoene desaturase family protein n=1 Tax=Streptomyces sp. NPDC127098 TaxID=3347137 RepID=UPI00364CC9BA
MRPDRLTAWGRPAEPGDRPRVVVIGGGIAGLATGCYAQMSGMDTLILEKHVLPGGYCTAWARDGYLFDYCVDWLSGTGDSGDAAQVWRELGALDGKEIAHFEMFNRVMDETGRAVTFYNDPDRLERHLLDLSPGDAEPIRQLCRYLRGFTGAHPYPILKPPPLKSTREKLGTALATLPLLRLFYRTATTQMADFAQRFKDPLLRRALPNIILQDPVGFPVLPYLYGMARAHNGNAGFPEGGSLGLVRSIEERYTGLGGQLACRARVERVLVENDRAVGVELKNGTRIRADHVVSACDGNTTVNGLLGGAYTSPRVDRLYREMLHEPDNLFPSAVSTYFGIDGPVKTEDPHSTTYLLPPEEGARLFGGLHSTMVVQLFNHYWEGFAPPGKSVIRCTYFSDFDAWKKLRTTNRREYWTTKRRVADFQRSFLERLYPGVDERIEVVDIATPVTAHRYTGNHNGTIFAWKPFSPADDEVTKLINKDRMRLPGLDGFSMTGQWVGMGGLIRAATTGRFVVQFICEELGLPFRPSPSPGGGGRWHREKLGHLPQLDTRALRQLNSRATDETAATSDGDSHAA